VSEAIAGLVFWAVAAALAALAWRRPGVALVTSLVTSAATTAIALSLAEAAGRHGPGGVTVKVFVVTLVAIYLYGPRQGREEWAYSVAKWLLFVLVPAFLIALSLGFGWVFLPAWLAIGTICVVRFLLVGRRAKVHYVVSTLSACMRQHLPLVAGLQAAALGRSDGRADTLRHIASALSAGMPLSDAIRRGYPWCDGEVIATIQAAERLDQVPLALSRLEADLVVRQAQRLHLRGCSLWYPFIVVLVVWSIVSFLCVFVVPAFKKILRDGGLALSQPMQSLVSLTNLASLWVGPAVLLALVAGPLAIYLLFRPRRAGQFQFWAWVGDQVRWRLPIGRWFERNASMLQAVEVLRMSLTAGRTVDESIAATITLDVNCCFRRRLMRWLDRVRAGETPAPAARAAGLGPSLAWAMDAHVNPNNAPAALEALESICRDGYSYRTRLLRFITWPLMVVAVGGLVGWVAYAVYGAMADIIRSAMPATLP
jgi:type II secretory pathway component PulF